MLKPINALELTECMKRLKKTLDKEREEASECNKA